MPNTAIKHKSPCSCVNPPLRRNGRNYYGKQRYICAECKRQFINCHSDRIKTDNDILALLANGFTKLQASLILNIPYATLKRYANKLETVPAQDDVNTRVAARIVCGYLDDAEMSEYDCGSAEYKQTDKIRQTYRDIPK